MERTTWTDERLDEKMKAIDTTFNDVRNEITELRREMRGGFAELRAEMAGIRSDLASSQRQVTLIVAGFGVGLLGILGGLAAAFAATQF